MGKARNDRRRIVDLVRDTAHQLAHRGELFGLLELRLAAPLVRDVAQEDEHPCDAAAFANRRIMCGRHPLAPVGPHEGNVEALHPTLECGRELLADRRCRARREEVDQAAVLGGPDQRPDGASRPVGFEDTSRAIHHDDRVGDGIHQETHVALRRGGSGERIHQRAGLGGDFLLQQLRVSPIGAERVREPPRDDDHGEGDQDRGAGVGLGRQGPGHGDRGNARKPDDDGGHPRHVARDGWRNGPGVVRGGLGRCERRGGGEQQ